MCLCVTSGRHQVSFALAKNRSVQADHVQRPSQIENHSNQLALPAVSGDVQLFQRVTLSIVDPSVSKWIGNEKSSPPLQAPRPTRQTADRHLRPGSNDVLSRCSPEPENLSSTYGRGITLACRRAGSWWACSPRQWNRTASRPTSIPVAAASSVAVAVAGRCMTKCRVFFRALSILSPCLSVSLGRLLDPLSVASFLSRSIGC